LNLSRLAGRENFTSIDLYSASIFASQVAQAVKNAKLYEELETKIKELQQTHQMLQQAQDQVVQTEKLVSIGRLVAGVAHEINNPLTSVIGYTELLINAELEVEKKEQLTVVFHEAQRCKRVVQDLLVFARRRDLHLEIVNIEKVINSSVSGLLPEITKNQVQIEKKYVGCTPIDADPYQLEQVLTNILVNAMQALQTVNGPKKIEIVASMMNEDRLQVIIKDTGPGIDETNLKRVFDPFFSTKEVGKGTGLGLSLAYGIVKMHAGDLSVKSQKGQGATFFIELPAKSVLGVVHAPKSAEDQKALPSNVEQATSTPKLSGQRVLLVEDEVAILNFMTRVLRSQGCLVSTAHDGEIALSKLIAMTFDIVLCDYRIPKMNGAILYQEIKKLKPEIANRFIFVTGSTADRDLDAFFSQNNLTRILKPFTLEEFFASIDVKLKEFHVNR